MRYISKKSRILTNMAKAKKLRSDVEEFHYLWMDVAVTR